MQPDERDMATAWEVLDRAHEAISFGNIEKGATIIAAALAEEREHADSVYTERAQCVALIARMARALGYTAGVARTDIPGWDPEWHGCIYVDLPTGQVSWHFHDSDAHLFDGLPNYHREWDGHDTPEKYRRVAAAIRAGSKP